MAPGHVHLVATFYPKADKFDEVAAAVTELTKKVEATEPDVLTYYAFRTEKEIVFVETAQVIQPLIVPGLCFFNTIPSLHLHVLARVNPPRLALWFSATLSALLFVSALVFIGSCAGRSGNNNKGSLQRDECPAGTGGKAGIWDAMVALQLVSAVMYAAMAVMAWKVKSVLEARDQRIAAGVELVSQEEKERRESEARERWRYLSAG
ncbi:hypothetical protein KCU88_g5433, partial [Aureobasidium melanogenum]